MSASYNIYIESKFRDDSFYWRVDSASDVAGKGVFIADGGLSGLVASMSDISTQGSHIDGQILHGIDYEPIEGSITLTAIEHDGVSLEEQYRSICEAFHPKRTKTIKIGSEDNSWYRGYRSLPVRLKKPIDPPLGWRSDRRYIEVTLDLISDDGYWTGITKSTPGEVDNLGDLPVPVRLIVHDRASSGRVKIVAPFGSSAIFDADGVLSINTDIRKLRVDVNGKQRTNLLAPASILTTPIPSIEEDGIFEGSGAYAYGAFDAETQQRLDLEVQWNERFISPWS